MSPPTKPPYPTKPRGRAEGPRGPRRDWRPREPLPEIEAKGRLVMGMQPVREAVRAHGRAIVEVLVDADPNARVEGLAREAEARGAPVRKTTRGELDRIAAGGRHQGAIAWAPPLRVRDLDELLAELDATAQAEERIVREPGAPGPEPLAALLLDGIMDPQNFGAIVRSAVALGAAAIVWPEHASAPLSPAMFRASAGAVEHARLAKVASLPTTLEALASRGATTVLLDAQGERELSQVDLRGPAVIVVGAEDKGARRAVQRACSVHARLPMRAKIASLNASVAVALALYELRRQRDSGIGGS